MILRNVGNYLPVDTASLSIRLEIFNNTSLRASNPELEEILNLTALRTSNTELEEICHRAIEILSVSFAGESE